MEDTDNVTWRKASRSGNGGNDCVEIGSASDGSARGIRDSKRPLDGYLSVTPDMLGALLNSIRNGELDMTRLVHHTLSIRNGEQPVSDR
jgi:hypothetical protein